MVVLNYIAPRVVKSGCCYSEFVQATNSILAGCQDANNMARISLYRLLDKMHKVHPKAPIDSFVDDMKQYAEGRTKDELVERLLPAVADFVESVGNLKLILSKKSVVLSSLQEVNHLVACVAASKGASIKKAEKAVDLGVDITSLRIRAVPTMAKRRLKAKARNLKTTALKFKDIRRKIFCQANVSAQTYGSEALGMAPSNIAKISSALALHLGAKPGWCSTTVLALEAPKGDPAIGIYQRKVASHLAFWLREKHLRSRLQDSWAFYLKELDPEKVPPHQTWRHVTGPTAATIAMLRDVNWKPLASDLWEAPDGQQWKLDDQPGDVRVLYEAFAKTIQDRKWAKAARHHLGASLVHPPDLTVPKKFLAFMRRNGRHAEAQLALTIMAGGLWTNTRAYDAGYVCSKRCPLCGIEDDNEYHRAWATCPAILQAQIPAVVTSAALQEQAASDVVDDPTFWLRGLPPLRTSSFPPKPDNMTVRCFGSLPWVGNKVDVSGYHVYLDESGGANARDARFARAGWGLALINVQYRPGGMPANTSFLGGLAGDTPGDFQTPPRACLEAFLYALRTTVGKLVVKPDASYLVDGFSAKRYLAPDGANADLWHAIGQELNNRQQEVEVIKVDAHLSQDMVVQGLVDIEDFHGNLMADALAAIGAGIHEVPAAIVTEQRALDKRTWRVLQRLVAVNLHFLSNVPARAGALRPRREKLARSALQRAFADADHDFGSLQCPKRIAHLPTRVTCSCCGQGASKKGMLQWLRQKKCSGPMVPSTTHGAEVSRPVRGSTVRVGRSDLHMSHGLRHRLGLWWCGTCGFYTTAGNASQKSSAKNLKKVCKGPALKGTAGRDYLDRIGLGKMPKRGLPWPNPAHCTQWANDPFAAAPRCRLNSKATLTLAELEASDLPDPVNELDSLEPVQGFEEEDPFDLGPAGFDQLV